MPAHAPGSPPATGWLGARRPISTRSSSLGSYSTPGPALECDHRLAGLCPLEDDDPTGHQGHREEGAHQASGGRTDDQADHVQQGRHVDGALHDHGDEHVVLHDLDDDVDDADQEHDLSARAATSRARDGAQERTDDGDDLGDPGDDAQEERA
jgi:hypothetical protein